MVGARFFRLEKAAGDESKLKILLKKKCKAFLGGGKKLNNVHNKILEILKCFVV